MSLGGVMVFRWRYGFRFRMVLWVGQDGVHDTVFWDTPWARGHFLTFWCTINYDEWRFLQLPLYHLVSLVNVFRVRSILDSIQLTNYCSFYSEFLATPKLELGGIFKYIERELQFELVLLRILAVGSVCAMVASWLILWFTYNHFLSGSQLAFVNREHFKVIINVIGRRGSVQIRFPSHRLAHFSSTKWNPYQSKHQHSELSICSCKLLWWWCSPSFIIL